MNTTMSEFCCARAYKLLVRTSTTAKPPSTTFSAGTTTTISSGAGSGGGTVQYAQCGGNGWIRPTTCVSPCKCTVLNPHYSQCL